MTNLFIRHSAFSLGRVATYLLSIFLLLTFLYSCTTTRHSSYFKNITRDTVISTARPDFAELKIKKGDVMSITVSSLSRTEDEIYNAGINPESINDAGVTTLKGFPVDTEGNIAFHKLGKVKAEGLTRKLLKSYLERELIPYLKDPIVTVNFGNHHITVIGEIGKPQVLSMTSEQISIVDVLAQSGGVTEFTDFNNIMLIREKENAKEFKHLNLEDHSIFSSPYFYLQPNDIVVLNPDEKKMQQKATRERNQQVSQLVFQSISLAIIIYQVFLRR